MVKISFDEFYEREGEPEPCKGLVYRAQESRYLTQKGFAQRIELNKLKRMSCPGCDTCGPMEDFLKEDMACGSFPEFPKGGLSSGRAYKLKFAGVKGYCPEDDDCWLELVLHEEKG